MTPQVPIFGDLTEIRCEWVHIDLPVPKSVMYIVKDRDGVTHGYNEEQYRNSQTTGDEPV